MTDHSDLLELAKDRVYADRSGTLEQYQRAHSAFEIAANPSRIIALIEENAAKDARIAQLEAEAKRLKDATWSDLSDADLGRCFKAFAQQVETTSRKKWSGDVEMRLGLMSMGLQQAIKMAAESNAETFTYTAEGFHSESRALGDWTVTIARLSSTATALKGADKP